MTDLRRVNMRVIGRVQGVGFRFYTKQQAKKFGIVGHVFNAPNGDVEIEATGLPEDLAAFEAKIRKGPSGALVRDVQVQVLPKQIPSQSFEIRHFGSI